MSLLNIPREELGIFPTPLHELTNLSRVLGGPRILIKREDLSGLGMGGNKTRKVERLLAYVRELGADAIVTTASAQSNYCLQIAAGARKLDMEIGLVLFTGQHPRTQGNILLHSILGSRIKIIEGEMTSPAYLEHCDEEMDKMVQEFRAQGRNPCIINSSKSSHISCLGASVYVELAEELYQQLNDRNIDARYLAMATSMGATCSGLILGFKLLKYPLRIINISVTLSKPVIEDKILNVANNTAKFIEVDVNVSPEDIVVYDEYLGEGYGIVSGECLEAMQLMARTEGIFLDPVYTGKAMAGMIDLIRKGELTSKDTVVFLHTGGLPAIFAYPEKVSEIIQK